MYNSKASFKNKIVSYAADRSFIALKNKVEPAQEINGIKIWNLTLQGADRDLIHKNLLTLNAQHYSSVGFIYSTFGGESKYYVVGSGDAAQKVNCNEIIKSINQEVNGKGGGVANFAQGGFKETPPSDKVDFIVSTGTANVVNFVKKVQ